MPSTTHATGPDATLVLMEGLDDSFWNAVPSPTPSPVKSRKTTLRPTPLKSKRIFSEPSTSRPPAPSPSKRFDAGDVNMDDFLAGAEDWDMDADPFSPKKGSPKKSKLNASAPEPPLYKLEECTRCVVRDVVEIEVNGHWSKKLDVYVDTCPQDSRTILLQDDWYDSDVRTGDIVNAIGSFDGNSIHITSQRNMLILHPDILLTATALSNAPQCRRKPLLSSLVRASNDISPALVWGNMLHEVMQRCLQEKRWEQSWINDRIDEVVQTGLASLLALNVTVETAKTELQRRAVGLQKFKERYISDVPKPDAVLSDTRSKANAIPPLLAISQLHEIEEDIWSPKYGLKGKLDATVEAVISEPPLIASKNPVMSSYLRNQSSSTVLTTGPRPFEIKTGRTLAGMEHRAQTMIYTLLASERYGVDVPAGLLYYTQSDEVVQVPRTRNEIRGLMVARNELAGYNMARMRKRPRAPSHTDQMVEDVGTSTSAVPRSEPTPEPFLPPAIDHEHSCKKCYVMDTCMLYRFASETESPPELGNPLRDAFDLKTGHLTHAQGEFFRKWENLLSLEERDLVRFQKELWTLGAVDREKTGRCFAGMVISNDSRSKATQQEGEDEDVFGSGLLTAATQGPLVQAPGDSKIHKYSYTFVRSRHFGFPSAPPPNQSQADASQRQAGSSLLHGHLSVGDAITLSVEPHLLALARGYITDLTLDDVQIGVDHAVDLGGIRARMALDKKEKGKAGLRGRGHDDDDEGKDEEIIFRIDKDELFGGMSRMRNNLAQLFYAHGDTRRLELVVDLRTPTFFDGPIAQLLDSMPAVYTEHLNASQRAAVAKVLSAQDYALILGMPGTGKTTTVAALIKILVEGGKTVLLTSYTHSAVDTILRTLDAVDFGVLRLGNVDKVHPDVRKYTLSARKPATTVEQLEAQWMTPPVVATTCLGVEHPVFNRRTFDYCIVDEASQITLPTCLGPLRYADKFILVGDHFQLPPLVKNPEARKGGLDVSLFRRLSDAHPHSVVDLREQYRMNADIMLLSNRLIYHDRLVCGSEEVAQRSLRLPNPAFLHEMHCWHEEEAGPSCPRRTHAGECWLERLTDERCKAVFVDTDALGCAHDMRVGDLVQNPVEAALVAQFVETLLRSAVPARQIGVLSLYRQQVRLITRLLAGGRGGGSVEVLTADKSQGRDKECIVISMTRSNDANQIGELVKDWRRMNVSFTRARAKLVIFGSRKTLRKDALLGQFFELMEGQGWVYTLPPDSHLVHEHDLAPTSTSTSPSCPASPNPASTPACSSESTSISFSSTAMSLEMPAQEASVLEPSSTLQARTEAGTPARTPPSPCSQTQDVGPICTAPDEPVSLDIAPNQSESRSSRSSTLVSDESIRSNVTPGKRNQFQMGDDDDDEVQIVQGPVPSSSSSSPILRVSSSWRSGSNESSSSSKTTPAKRQRVAEDADADEVEIVCVVPSNAAPKKANGNAKGRGKAPGKVNANAKAKGKGKEKGKGKGKENNGGTLDFWLKSMGACKSQECRPEGAAVADADERPKKRVRGVASEPALKERAAVVESNLKRAQGLLKGRPILQDLAKNEA